MHFREINKMTLKNLIMKINKKKKTKSLIKR